MLDFKPCILSVCRRVDRTSRRLVNGVGKPLKTSAPDQSELMYNCAALNSEFSLISSPKHPCYGTANAVPGSIAECKPRA